MSVVRNSDWGETGVDATITRWPARSVDDDECLWHDARTVDPIVTENRSLTVVESDVPIEVKVAAYRVADGDSSRRGRFKICRRNHEPLLNARGEYAFGVYDENGEAGDPDAIIRLSLVPAFVVDSLIDGVWSRCADGIDAATLPWSSVFDPQEVNR